MADIVDQPYSLEPLLEMYERDERNGQGEMPYPPDYPKMPGEPGHLANQNCKSDYGEPSGPC